MSTRSHGCRPGPRGTSCTPALKFVWGAVSVYPASGMDGDAKVKFTARSKMPRLYPCSQASCPPSVPKAGSPACKRLPANGMMESTEGGKNVTNSALSEARSPRNTRMGTCVPSPGGIKQVSTANSRDRVQLLPQGSPLSSSSRKAWESDQSIGHKVLGMRCSPGGTPSSPTSIRVTLRSTVPAYSTNNRRVCPPVVRYASPAVNVAVLRTSRMRGLSCEKSITLECAWNRPPATSTPTAAVISRPPAGGSRHRILSCR